MSTNKIFLFNFIKKDKKWGDLYNIKYKIIIKYFIDHLRILLNFPQWFVTYTYNKNV